MALSSLLAAAVLLVFDSAATIQVGYTITLSYILSGLTVLAALPWVIEAARRLPAIAVCAALMIVAYGLAAVLGHPRSFSASSRGGSSRELVYMADLVIALLSLLLIPQILHHGRQKRMAVALATAGGLAGAYGLYQWCAFRWGLPGGDINNTLDPNLLTKGASQGIGLLGSERIRGTFLEPHFFAAFLASVLPLQVWVIVVAREKWRVLALIGALASLLALVLTDSAPGWGDLLLAALFSSTVFALGRGRSTLAMAGAIAAAVTFVGIVLFVTDPALLSPLTGRSGRDLAVTTNFRTGTWKVVLQLWRQHPIVGTGPGQSSIRLAYALAAPAQPRVLATAQGIWSSSMLDAGMLGLLGWSSLVICAGLLAGRGLRRHPTGLRYAAFAAMVAVLLENLVAADRWYPRDWIILGFALAVTTRAPSATARESDVSDGQRAPARATSYG